MLSRKIKVFKTMKYCEEYTVLELKEMAKAQNIKGYSKMKKADLCELLNIKNRPVISRPPKTTLAKRQTRELEPIVLFTPNKKSTTTTTTTQLIPVEVVTTNGNKKAVTITAYIKPCDVKNLVFPCTIKKGVFVDKDDWTAYQTMKQKTRVPGRIDRAEYARQANLQFEIENEYLKNKKPHTQKVKFNI
jgi:hypothetical protein